MNLKVQLYYFCTLSLRFVSSQIMLLLIPIASKLVNYSSQIVSLKTARYQIRKRQHQIQVNEKLKVLICQIFVLIPDQALLIIFDYCGFLLLCTKADVDGMSSKKAICGLDKFINIQSAEAIFNNTIKYQVWMKKLYSLGLM